MLKLIPPQALLVCLNAIVSAETEDYTLTDRAYVILQKQNLGKIVEWCYYTDDDDDDDTVLYSDL